MGVSWFERESPCPWGRNVWGSRYTHLSVAQTALVSSWGSYTSCCSPYSDPLKGGIPYLSSQWVEFTMVVKGWWWECELAAHIVSGPGSLEMQTLVFSWLSSSGLMEVGIMVSAHPVHIWISQDLMPLAQTLPVTFSLCILWFETSPSKLILSLCFWRKDHGKAWFNKCHC